MPGIMVWPGKVKPGTQVTVPCFTSDYFPTIANILGVDIEAYDRPYDGIDLLPIVQGKLAQRSKPLAFEFQDQAALMDGSYKIYSSDGGDHFKLYDISVDSAETIDLAKQEPDKLKLMSDIWHRWKASQINSANGKDYH